MCSNSSFRKAKGQDARVRLAGCGRDPDWAEIQPLSDGKRAGRGKGSRSIHTRDQDKTTESRYVTWQGKCGIRQLQQHLNWSPCIHSLFLDAFEGRENLYFQDNTQKLVLHHREHRSVLFLYSLASATIRHFIS